MLIRFGKNYDLVLPSIEQYDQVHQDIFWYLLNQTNVYRWVDATTLREFLIRYFLISNRPIDQTAKEFIDEGILISGTIGDKAFCFGMKDLFQFVGFGCTNQKYHLGSTFDEFVANFVKSKFLVKIEPNEEKEAIDISKEALILVLAGVGTLLQIDSLNLEFRENLHEVRPEEIARVTTFVDYVIQLIPESFFADYQVKFAEELSAYTTYHVPVEVIDFNPFTQMPKADLIAIFEHIIPENYQSFVEFRNQDIVDPEVIEDLSFYAIYVRFAYGVKHGFVKVNDEPYALDNYSEAFKLDPLEELAGEDFEMWPTSHIYKVWDMDNWIHLVP